MALYRKYRPGSFAELVGQEQVTIPLINALDSGRINHAYLFTGPRGCGKTSSARIMARSLNCAEGPTSTPCGVCHSCIALAPNGPGSIDVTELDAASNRGVDDMNELRDRAMYAPAESRYRIFIIDEAHMITREGANALLKVVEEPPAHLIFIFATTEPEKILPTIRSRVHSYPFRLLTPQAMTDLLKRTVAGEQATVSEDVYPMVVRAGGGSPRDTLSLLDQLLAGAGESGLGYEQARMLLGATDDALIDAAIEAIAAKDVAALFAVVDDVIEMGLDPRRFASDLLERIRDLMILHSVPDALEIGLVDAPTDRGEILSAQAQSFSSGELPRIGTLLSEDIATLRGATSPRLLLEILCAKMIITPLPEATFVTQDTNTSVAMPATASASPVVATKGASTRTDKPVVRYERKSQRLARERAEKEAQAAQSTEQEAQPQSPPALSQAKPEQANKEQQPQPAVTKPQPTPEVVSEPEVAQPTIQDVQAKWTTVKEIVEKQSAVMAALLAGASVLGIKDKELIIGHNTGALVERLNAENNRKILAQVLGDEVGLTLALRFVINTDPAAHGFAVDEALQVWQPEAELDAELEAIAQPTTKDEPAVHTKPAAEPVEAEPVEPEPVAAEPEPEPVVEKPAADPWGEPAPIGQSVAQPTPLRTKPPQYSAPEPELASPEPEVSRPRWQEAAERGRAHMAELAARPQFSDGVPLPPEPEDDNEPPMVDPYGYDADEGIPETTSQPATPQPTDVVATQVASQQEEEEMMAAAAAEPGTMDHRDAMTVAMDMLAAELGAKRI
ncbi:DNA polymerase III subunit gamma and tau [Corynebacterium kutscheri]|uniref:DNA polymerase III subunit gamma/tau n=1 Tax=Corynebacterium kutscheri TaxID=35755 RepID=A0AB38VQ46_9CORY|nr:DNA polymerase III subunit gamma and tau [Corynebacterium kutscheri]VEH05319.1 DNA polymerase III subunit gamma/tau [Corynebacterium kutscheri]